MLRAIDRGTGEGDDAVVVERIQFEGYGPGGAAILVDALTDNRNRTSAEVRHAFTRHGGSLGEPGSVAWMFETHGVVVIDGDQLAIRLTPKCGCSGKSRPDGRITSIHGAPARLRA